MKSLIASTIPLCIINLFSSIGQMRFFLLLSLAHSASVLQAKSGNCITQSICTERCGCCCCCQSIHHQSKSENRMMEGKKYRKLNRNDSGRTMKRQMHELLFSFLFSSRNLRIAIFCCRSVAVVDYSIVSGLAFVASFDFLNCQTVK